LTDALARLIASLADRYRIEREIGQGGMATVYLAHDIKHDRPVAIKVLRPELAAVIGAERFLSEIKTTANLQHPHILPLFDSGVATVTAADSLTTHDSRLLFYVMPYVEGESLRDRLVRDKQLSITDAVRIATEVAGALDYAHRRGIVHRDIKPENILLHDGRALVADFGIALAASKAGDSRMTQTGMSLGTPAYMSPEQAMGERDIGPRSDIYALGAMTYEMLTADPPFSGATVQSIVAKVMTEKPIPPTRIRDTVPPNVEHAVLTALQKLPADRFASAKEFADALVTTSPSSGSYAPTIATGATRPTRPTRPTRLTHPVTLAAIALISTAAGVAGWAFRGARAPTGPTIYDAALPDSAAITFAATTSTNAFGSARRNLSISPNGDFVVYTSRHGDSTQFWYRSLKDASSHPIDGSEGGTGPRISPDGSRIAYTDGSRVVLIPIGGGKPRVLLDAQVPGTPEWLSNTELFLQQRTGNRLTWLDPEGGVTRSVDVTRPCILAHWIPKDRQVLCSYNGTASIVDPTSKEEWNLRAARPDGSPGALLAGNGFLIVDGAYVVYMSVDGVLRAAPYDHKRHLAGRSVALNGGVRSEALGDVQMDLSTNGTLVFAPGVNATAGRVVRFHPGQAPEPMLTEAAGFQRIDVSRDGRWLAAAVQTADGQELRLYDLRDGQRSTALSAELVRQPLWSPAGDRLLVATRDSTLSSILMITPGSGRRPDTVLAVQGPALTVDPIDYPDEHTVLVQDWGTNVTRRFDPTVSPAHFDTVLTAARFPAIAPGGKHIIYQAGGASGVMVTSYPVAGRRWQVAADGVEPLWLSPTEILYRSGVVWYLTRINPVTGEPLGPATLWGRDPRFNDTSGWSNRPDWHGGIIYVQGPAEVSANFLRVVPNWVAQMKAAVAAANH